MFFVGLVCVFLDGFVVCDLHLFVFVFFLFGRGHGGLLGTLRVRYNHNGVAEKEIIKAQLLAFIEVVVILEDVFEIGVVLDSIHSCKGIIIAAAVF